ncbi:MAG: hypothetical protein M3O28_02840 [Actinomycetota bacterium]|nr:hypothetical protein [Actinomycetota bacterium]
MSEGNPEDGARHDPTGSFAQEADRLLASVQDWAQRSFPGAPREHIGAECGWCPLCQFVAMLRGERPELTERVTEAASAAVGALRALVDATAEASSHAGQHRHERGPATPHPHRVERIDLGDRP